MRNSLFGLALCLLCGCDGPEKGGQRGLFTDRDGGGEGTCGGEVCDANATCAGSGDSAQCECRAGFSGDGTACQDVNECGDGSLNDCNANATCVNRSGGYDCECKPGFSGDGRICAGVDECAGITNTCDPNAVCEDADPKFTCTCKNGFTGDGFGCGDVNECADGSKYSCANNARCVNTFGGYACECLAGFAGDGATACRGLCEIASADRSQCAAEGVCRIDGRGAVCDACEPGFRGNGVTCQPATCQSQCDGQGADAPNTICLSDGSCACAPGYQGAVGSCTDVNECAAANGGCGEHATCVNATGGHLCTCQPGYALDDSGNCTDVDECKQSPGPCHPDATCTNTAPDGSGRGYTCTCKPGFTGDGSICRDIDECASGNGGCVAGSVCINERGSKRCECPPPLVGTGGVCHCDLTGMWAMRHDLDTCWAGRPIQEGSTEYIVSGGEVEASVWELYEITYDGQTFSLRGKGCGADNEPDLISPLFRETYSAYIPYSVYQNIAFGSVPSFAAPGLVPRDNFVTPSIAGVSGLDLGDDPLNAPWPPSFDAIPADKWLDPDEDGEPGMTLWPRLPSQTTDSGTRKYSYLPARPAVGGGGSGFYIDERAGCVSLALRVIAHLEVSVESCARLVGEIVNERTEGRVRSCTLVDKGTCSPTNPSDCSGWREDISCGREDWANARRCGPEELERLDDDQNQKQNSKASFVMERLGAKGMPFTCDDVRAKLPAIQRTVPTIRCTRPE